MSPLSSLWLSWVITASFPIVAQAGVARISPITVAWLAALLGVCYFLPWLVKSGAWKGHLNKKTFRTLAGMGAMGTAFPVIIFCAALKYTTPANAAILGQIEVVYSIILARLFLGEKPVAAQLTGTLLVLAGTCLIVFNERFSPRWTGDVLIIAAGWFYQTSHVLAKRLPPECSPRFIASGRALFGFLTLTPIMAGALLFSGQHFSPDATALAALSFQGLILTGFNNVLWYTAIRNMDLAKATAIILSYPVMTVIFSWSLGRETIHGYQLAGLALAMAGAYRVTLLVKTSKKTIIPPCPDRF